MYLYILRECCSYGFVNAVYCKKNCYLEKLTFLVGWLSCCIVGKSCRKELIILLFFHAVIGFVLSCPVSLVVGVGILGGCYC